MADLNSVSLVGRLTRDVEAPAGNGPARFAIAVNRRVKQGDAWTEEASFFDIEYWHKTILPYLLKGRQVAVSGELKQDRWADRESGQPRSRIIIAARDVQLLGGGTREEGQGGAQSGQAARGYQARPAGAQAAQGASQAGPQADDFTDDIPF